MAKSDSELVCRVCNHSALLRIPKSLAQRVLGWFFSVNNYSCEHCHSEGAYLSSWLPKFPAYLIAFTALLVLLPLAFQQPEQQQKKVEKIISVPEVDLSEPEGMLVLESIEDDIEVEEVDTTVSSEALSKSSIVIEVEIDESQVHVDETIQPTVVSTEPQSVKINSEVETQQETETTVQALDPIATIEPNAEEADSVTKDALLKQQIEDLKAAVAAAQLEAETQSEQRHKLEQELETLAQSAQQSQSQLQLEAEARAKIESDLRRLQSEKQIDEAQLNKLLDKEKSTAQALAEALEKEKAKLEVRATALAEEKAAIEAQLVDESVANQSSTDKQSHGGLALLPGEIYDESTLLQLPSNSYTIQLASSASTNDVSLLINRLQNSFGLKSMFFYYLSPRQSTKWYPVLYGHFQSRAAATAAKKSLPNSIQKSNPYVRKLEKIQQVILESSD